MEENLKRVFQQLKYIPNSELADNIWHKISVREKRIVYLKLAAFSSLGLFSLGGLIPMLKIVGNDFAQSGFYEYLSILFSGSGSIASYWRELMFSLAESFPATSIVLSLALLFLFFLSLRYLMKQIINNDHIGQTYGVA